MSSYTQLALGLRSLAVKIAIFLCLAGVLAWVIGGSIFPGSQVVNLPAFEWGSSTWHMQVRGNGRSPSPVVWRLLSSDPAGSEVVQTLGVLGEWSQVIGPFTGPEKLTLGICTMNDERPSWWIAEVDRNGTPSARQVENEIALRAVVSAAP